MAQVSSASAGKPATADEVHIAGKRLFRKRRDPSVDGGAMLNQTAVFEEG
jgi:hypothetical protein